MTLRVGATTAREPETGNTGYQSISLVMIVRDEGKNLGRCLASVAGLVDEIIIVDTGSTDDTIAVASNYNALVYAVPWRDNFAEARNAGLLKATSRWALVLDADEELVIVGPRSFDDARHLRKALTEDAILDVSVLNLMDRGTVEHRTPRLFPILPSVSYVGAIHEVPHDSRGILRHKDADGFYIKHHGYTSEAIAAKDKNTRNLRMLEAEAQRNPSNPQTRIYWAQALRQAGYHASAADQARLAIHLLAASPVIHVPSYGTAAVTLVTCLAITGDYAQAYAEGLAVQRRCAIASPMFWVTLGNAAHGYAATMQGDEATRLEAYALSCFARALAPFEPDGAQIDHGAVTWMPLAGIAATLANLGLTKAAREVAERAMLVAPVDGPDREQVRLMLAQLKTAALGLALVEAKA